MEVIFIVSDDLSVMLLSYFKINIKWDYLFHHYDNTMPVIKCGQ